MATPIEAPQFKNRPGVHSMWARWQAGICSAIVLWAPLRLLRGWLDHCPREREPTPRCQRFELAQRTLFQGMI